jgi:hypothetical protein
MDHTELHKRVTSERRKRTEAGNGSRETVINALRREAREIRMRFPKTKAIHHGIPDLNGNSSQYCQDERN